MNEDAALHRDGKKLGAFVVERLLTQHLDDLAAFVQLHTDPLLRNYESCSDVTQSVCHEVLQCRGNFEFRGAPAFRNWLFTLAQRKLVSHRRHYLAQRRDVRREVRAANLEQRAIDEVHASFGSPTQGAIARETADRLEHAFDRLPANYRTVITMSRLLGLSHSEIAAKMSRKEGAVRTLLNRALVRLARHMADAEDSLPSR